MCRRCSLPGLLLVVAGMVAAGSVLAFTVERLDLEAKLNKTNFVLFSVLSPSSSDGRSPIFSVKGRFVSVGAGSMAGDPDTKLLPSDLREVAFSKVGGGGGLRFATTPDAIGSHRPYPPPRRHHLHLAGGHPDGSIDSCQLGSWPFHASDVWT